ncbi:MAG TPA: histidine phosphatase family protein [Aquabacterium sp.]|nr:histidine phosphatase family protein [Aquabacterium sp.]
MTVHAFRHPRPQGHEGRCIGQTDLTVDPRKARRLARRIRRLAHRRGWPRVVCTSPLRRCHRVGRELRRWGWRHAVDPALMEMDFGRWDGLPWSLIPRDEIDVWCEHFADHAPGVGESLRQFMTRVHAWEAPVPQAVVVAHAGWMLARRWCETHGTHAPPTRAAVWPHPPAYGECWTLALSGKSALKAAGDDGGPHRPA